MKRSNRQAGTAVTFHVSMRRAGVAMAVGVLALLGGCAALDVGANAPSGQASDRTGWGNWMVDVSDVLPGDTPGTILLRTESSRAPECADEPTVDVTVEGERIYVTVSAMHSPDEKVAGVRCAVDPTERDLPLNVGPLGDGTILIVNQETWELADSGGFARCDLYLGCGTPPEDPCDGYLGQFVSQLDVPQHTSQGVWGCDGTWMVYSVDPATSFCGPSDGESTCDVPSQQRIAILRFDPDVPAWVVQAWTTPPVTCADVGKLVPAMPQATCLSFFAAS